MIVGKWRAFSLRRGRARIIGKSARRPVDRGNRREGKNRGEDGGPQNGRPEHRSSDAQIKGGLSKAKTGSSGGRTADQVTFTQEPPGATGPWTWTSAFAKGAGWQHACVWCSWVEGGQSGVGPGSSSGESWCEWPQHSDASSPCPWLWSSASTRPQSPAITPNIRSHVNKPRTMPNKRATPGPASRISREWASLPPLP